MLHSDFVTFRQYVAKKAGVFCDFDDIALIVQIFCLCLSDLDMLIFLRILCIWNGKEDTRFDAKKYEIYILDIRSCSPTTILVGWVFEN